MTEITPKLEAVYYGSPIPLSKASLTFLGVVFDTLHFPNVNLPDAGFDPAAVAQEANRIEGHGFTDYNTQLLVGALRILPLLEDLKQFCHFAAQEGQVFGGVDKDKETQALAAALDELVFGPPKAGFIRTFETGFNKGLPGCDLSVDYPGVLHYPANAIVYAARHHLPLVNDNPLLPVPALGGQDAKNNARVLATILAMECVNLVLPMIRPLSPREVVELREDLRDYLQPFRSALMRLAAELNRGISQSATHEEIVEAARFVVETEVQPTLVELQSALSKPAKHWTVRGFELAKQVPELASAFATMPLGLAVAKAMAVFGGVFVDIHEKRAQREAARSPMYYLLRLKRTTDGSGSPT